MTKCVTAQGALFVWDSVFTAQSRGDFLRAVSLDLPIPTPILGVFLFLASFDVILFKGGLALPSPFPVSSLRETGAASPVGVSGVVCGRHHLLLPASFLGAAPRAEFGVFLGVTPLHPQVLPSYPSLSTAAPSFFKGEQFLRVYVIRRIHRLPHTLIRLSPLLLSLHITTRRRLGPFNGATVFFLPSSRCPQRHRLPERHFGGQRGVTRANLPSIS